MDILTIETLNKAVRILITLSMIIVTSYVISPFVYAADSDDFDTVLKNIGRKHVKEVVEKSESYGDAAKELGIDEATVRNICTSFGIYLKGVKTDTASLTERLANNYYNPEVVLSFDGLTPYLLLVDKHEHKLHLIQYENGKRNLIKSYECKTGKKLGDKEKEGDNKTPEGVFFFVNRHSRPDIIKLVGRDNAFQYGDMAFVTNFPNPIDRGHGKNGGGIWLHGTDSPFDESALNNTRGCVVTTNEVINELSTYIKLYETPIVIVKKLELSKSEIVITEAEKVLSAIEKWRTAWKNKDIDAYQSFYSSSFSAQGMNRKQWVQRKRNIFNAYNIKKVDLDHFMIFRHNSGLVVKFTQDYSADNISKNIGTKTLYLMPDGDSWSILTEHFRKM